MPASGKAGAALSSAAWAMAVLFCARRVTDRAGIGQAAPHPGPACTRSHVPSGSPPGPGDYLALSGRTGPCPSTPGEGLILYDLEQHRSLTFRYGQDSKVTCLGYAAWALWLLGYPDQARARMHEMLTLAQELSHPFTLVFALNWAACVHRFRREWSLLHKRAEEVIALSREHEFAQR